MLEKIEKDSFNVDIFYSTKDVTSLRWLSEIKYEITKYKTSLVFRIFELSSDYAKSKNIAKETISFENIALSMNQLKNIINQHKLEYENFD